MDQVLFGIACASAGFLLGYFFRRATAEGYTDGGIIDEQQRGITSGPGYQPRRNPDAPLSREDRPPAPPGPRSNKPRKPRRNGKYGNN